MQKSDAIRLLGGTPTSAAAAIGVTVSAVTQWPDVLPQRLIDRVQAALWRQQQGEQPHPTAHEIEVKAA